MDLDCLVTFTSTLCVIQNRHLRSLIRQGENRDGWRILPLRHATPRIVASSVSHSSISDVWHQLLGHVSSSSLSFLSNKLSFTLDSSKCCDICHRSKQTRLQFPLG